MRDDNKLYISYSGDKTLDECDYKYWLGYDSDILPESEDKLGSIYGIVVGKLFESFYTDQLWRHKDVRQVMHDMVPNLVHTVLEEETQEKKGRPAGKLLWRGEGPGMNPIGLYENSEHLITDSRAAIPRGLTAIKENGLLGKDAKAEYKLDSDINGFRLGGRADFVMTRFKEKDVVIIDGKGTTKPGKYTDPKQLLWYSLLYREKTGRLPDKTAFLYWKFEFPVNMEWHEPTAEKVDALKEEMLEKMSKLADMKIAAKPHKSNLPMIQEIFKPKANQDNCRFCVYGKKEICPKGFGVKEKMRVAAEARAQKENICR